MMDQNLRLLSDNYELRRNIEKVYNYANNYYGTTVIERWIQCLIKFLNDRLENTVILTTMMLINVFVKNFGNNCYQSKIDHIEWLESNKYHFINLAVSDNEIIGCFAI